MGDACLTTVNSITTCMEITYNWPKQLSKKKNLPNSKRVRNVPCTDVLA